MRPIQCVELCRGKDQEFAVENTEDKQCHCIKEDPSNLPKENCAEKKFKVQKNKNKIFKLNLYSKDI